MEILSLVFSNYLTVLDAWPKIFMDDDGQRYLLNECYLFRHPFLTLSKNKVK